MAFVIPLRDFNEGRHVDIENTIVCLFFSPIAAVEDPVFFSAFGCKRRSKTTAVGLKTPSLICTSFVYGDCSHGNMVSSEPTTTGIIFARGDYSPTVSTRGASFVCANACSPVEEGDGPVLEESTDASSAHEHKENTDPIEATVSTGMLVLLPHHTLQNRSSLMTMILGVLPVARSRNRVPFKSGLLSLLI